MDYPYQHAVDEVGFLDALDLSIEDKTKFFQTNAEQLFKLHSA
jgi:2,3-dihydroxybenzoate decarboxylase